MGRIQKLGVAIGSKGVGKTYKTTELIQQYVVGNPAKGIPGRKVLILDVNQEFEHVKTLDVEMVQAFSAHHAIEVRRILPRKKDGTKMTLDEVAATLLTIVQNFYGGMLLIEDINKYVSDHLPNDLVGAICTNRHSDVDVIMHYQSIGRIPPKVWGNLDYIRFHKIKESVARHANKYEDKAECLTLAENIVNDQYETNPRFYLFVDVEMVKIKGNLTSDMISKSIKKYIYDNYKTLIKPKIGVPSFENPDKAQTASEIIDKEQMRLLKYFQ